MSFLVKQMLLLRIFLKKMGLGLEKDQMSKITTW